MICPNCNKVEIKWDQMVCPDCYQRLLFEAAMRRQAREVWKEKQKEERLRRDQCK